VPTAIFCNVPGLYGRDLNILLSFFFVKQEEGVYVLYALSLDGLGIKMTDIGLSDPSVYLAPAAAVVPTAIFCTVQGLYERVLHILLSFFFGKQEEGVYVLYALSLDSLGTKLTEIGWSDPLAYLAAAAAVVPTAIFSMCRGCTGKY
jgi:hypothetical protein